MITDEVLSLSQTIDALNRDWCWAPFTWRAFEGQLLDAMLKAGL